MVSIRAARIQFLLSGGREFVIQPKIRDKTNSFFLHLIAKQTLPSLKSFPNVFVFSCLQNHWDCFIFAPMKLLACILTIYLLGLNFVSCNDLIPQKSETQITQVSADQNHDHQDDCSPFCQCHCCHVHVIEINATAFSTNQSELYKPLFFHRDNSGFELPKSFLQPPRV